MRTTKLLLLPALVAGAFLLSDCSPKAGKATTASSDKGTTASTTAPHYSEAQLAEGQTIYTTNCGKCHKLFAPADKSLSKWEAVLPPMIKKAKLNDEQGLLVRAYVMANLKS
jgi:mono/diheme cytochrome c family protein